MAWPRKKKDAASERERALRTEIEHLEAQIRELSTRTQGSDAGEPRASAAPSPVPAGRPRGPAQPGQPRLRSTVLPGRQGGPEAGGRSAPRPTEQVFEKVDHKRLEAGPEAANRALYNELGVRKYDLPGAWQRLVRLFQGSSAQNQTLVRLLAAGNIQGLRPLRYEKRVARRRFIIFVVVLFLLLWGILAMFLRH